MRKMKKKIFLEKFYNDKAKQNVLQIALYKASKLDLKSRIKYYSDELNKLEKEMCQYILENEKIVKKINFNSVSNRYKRISIEKQKQLTDELIGIPMDIDQLQEWSEGTQW